MTEQQSTEPTEPTEAPQEPSDDQVAPEPSDQLGGPEAAPLDAQDPSNDQPTPDDDAPEDDPHAVKPVTEAAPDQVADVSGSYFGTVETADGATPMADQDLAQPDHLAQTEETQKGFHGHVPTSDEDRHAMTLAGRKAAREQAEADGTQEPGLDGTGDLNL